MSIAKTALALGAPSFGLWFISVGQNTIKLARSSYRPEIEDTARKTGVPANLIRAIIMVESGFDPNAQAKGSSARGLMQITRGAAEEVKANHDDLFNPRFNIQVGASYLGIQISRFGFLDGIRSYNAGPGSIRYPLSHVKFWAESWAYFARVMRFYSAFERAKL